MQPLARLSEFDETWHIYSPYALLPEMEYLFIWASTSGVRAPPSAEASLQSTRQIAM